MSIFIELDKELDGFDNTSIDLSLSYRNFINMMHIDTKYLNNTDNSVNELFFFEVFLKEIKYKISFQLIKTEFAIFLSFRKIEVVSIV